MEKLLELFFTGGLFMYPLALFSVVVLAIVIERMLTERAWRKKVQAFLNYIGGSRDQEKENQMDKMMSVEESFWHSSIEMKEKIIEEKLQGMFERRIRVNEIISAIGNTAPLVGFIGTVSGMIASFGAIANADKVSVKLVASGISEALVTTGFGLVIATVCIVSDALLRYWFTKFSHSVEEEVIHILGSQSNTTRVNSVQSSPSTSHVSTTHETNTTTNPNL